MSTYRWFKPLVEGWSAFSHGVERHWLGAHGGDVEADGDQAATQHAIETIRAIHLFSANVLDNIERHTDRLDFLEELVRNELDDNVDAAAGDSDLGLDEQRSFFEYLRRECRTIQRDSLCIESYVIDALTDSLTQVANRRAFDFELRRRYSEWNRNRQPISLIMVDIDRFKQLNDLHGHPAGDQLLRDFAELLVRSVRETDQVARYGGEEFGVILPNTTLDVAETISRSLCHHIEEHSFAIDESTISLTASLGIATAIADEDEDDRSLVRRADMALYAAKRCGRNCVFKHDGLDCESVVHGAVREHDSEMATRTPRDPLTDLHDAATFHEYLEYRIAEHVRYDTPFSIMSVRIDDFDAIQDSTPKTEAALRVVARFIVAALRSADFVARLEKDRFAAILPATQLDDVLHPAERLRRSVARYECFEVDGEPFRMTVSVGAVEAGDSRSGKELMNRALEATNAAYLAGGDRIYGQNEGMCLDLDALSLLETVKL